MNASDPSRDLFTVVRIFLDSVSLPFSQNFHERSGTVTSLLCQVRHFRHYPLKLSLSDRIRDENGQHHQLWHPLVWSRGAPLTNKPPLSPFFPLWNFRAILSECPVLPSPVVEIFPQAEVLRRRACCLSLLRFLLHSPHSLSLFWVGLNVWVSKSLRANLP